MIIGAVNKQREKRGSEKSRHLSVRAGECVVGRCVCVCGRGLTDAKR